MTLTAAQLAWVKRALFVLALLPLAIVVLDGVEGRLGANPIETITRASGDWTLYFLCFTLAVTPLRRLTGQQWLQKLRRMLGLFTFFYASLHFLCFIWFDHFFDLGEMLKDVIKRPFITVGFTAFVLLVPLALSSSDAMVRKLGRHWARLHRLVYVVAVLAILHFWWMRAGKNDFAEPLLFGVIVALLLGLRIVFRWRAARAAARSLAVEISVKDPG
jgi:methionine sulfoxide reductase heme-binding subunit